MFSPTKFPSSAFIVTPELAIRCIVLTGQHRTPGHFRDGEKNTYRSDQLFLSRLYAIAHAQKLLAEKEVEHARAGEALQRLRAEVDALRRRAGSRFAQPEPTQASAPEVTA